MKDIFEKYGITISDSDVSLLEKYSGMLIDWNERINLTSITDPSEIIIKHFLDSALVVTTCDRLYQTVLDVGTGAGFPGMVLAILNPSSKVTLMEPLAKRVDFLNAVVSELSLSNVTVVRGRAEEFGHDPDFRSSFDLVVSRAVSELRVLTELCLPFVSDDGVFVSYKGPQFENEISDSNNAFSELNCVVVRSYDFSIGDNERHLVIIKHDGKMSDKYPRRNGIPAKRPL